VFDAEVIFAFSITFMAISIQVPHLSDNNNMDSNTNNKSLTTVSSSPTTVFAISIAISFVNRQIAQYF